MAMASKKPGPVRTGGAAGRRKKRNGGNGKYIVLALVFAVAAGGAGWHLTRPSLEKAEQLLSAGRHADAIAMFTDLADGGDPAAARKLGMLYYAGDEVPQDHAKAIPYLRTMAEAGDRHAQSMLGGIYYSGSGGSQNHALAMRYLLPLEDSNDAAALALLGQAYHRGQGVLPDNDKAFTLLEKAASLGSAEGKDILGLLHYQGRGTRADAKKGLSLMAGVPAGVNRDVDRILGKAYFLGRDIEQSLPKAAERLGKWPVEDDAEACYCLGMLHREGRGVPQDDRQAERYLSLAADKGVAAAILPLGSLYYYGGGGTPDYAKARILLERAAANGEGKAYSLLGKMYYEGMGVEPDRVKAADYIKRAVAKDHSPENSFLLGKLFYDGDGMDQDYTQAAGYLSYAADKGFVDAQVMLAHLYYHGRGGLKQDYGKTLQLLQRGVDEDNPAALALRGRMYYYGDGGDWNEAQAVEYLRRAAAAGNNDATRLLNEKNAIAHEKAAERERMAALYPGKTATPGSPSGPARSTPTLGGVDMKLVERVATFMSRSKYSKYTKYGLGNIELGDSIDDVKKKGYDVVQTKEAGGTVYRIGDKKRNLANYIAKVDANKYISLLQSVETVSSFPKDRLLRAFGRLDDNDIVSHGRFTYLRYTFDDVFVFVVMTVDDNGRLSLNTTIMDIDDYRDMLMTEGQYFYQLISFMYDALMAKTHRDTTIAQLTKGTPFSIREVGKTWYIDYTGTELVDKKGHVAAIMNNSAVLRAYKLKSEWEGIPTYIRFDLFNNIMQSLFPPETEQIDVKFNDIMGTFSWNSGDLRVGCQVMGREKGFQNQPWAYIGPRQSVEEPW